MIIQHLQQQLHYCQYMYNQQQSEYENKLNEQKTFYKKELQKFNHSKTDSAKVEKSRENALLIEDPYENKSEHNEALKNIDKLKKDLDYLTRQNNYLNSSLRTR